MATVIERDKNRYEVVKVLNPDDQVLNVSVVGNPAGETSTATDAFGRLRVSNPMTVFDSSHRYADNGQWSTSTATGGASTFNSNQGLIDLTVNSTSGSKTYRETLKTFVYQPGKSLLVLNTFVFNPGKTNLRQRVGFFGTQNGIYLELSSSTLSIVKRSSVTGSIVNTGINQSSWNGDKLDGTGTSGLTLDITKAQILWMDVEWLGVGAVRVGFVIDGKFIVCHTFKHANTLDTTYMTTACLPIRYEIENTGATASSSTLKQICSTVISEGGYEMRGGQRSVNTTVTSPVSLTTAGTYYTVISLRLKTSPDRLDAIVLLSALSVMGITNNVHYHWKLISGGTSSGTTWTSVGTDSSVEFKIDGGTFSGGRTLASGYSTASNQAIVPVDVLKEALFRFQLERDSFTSTPLEMSLVVSGSTNAAEIHATMDFEEVSR